MSTSAALSPALPNHATLADRLFARSLATDVVLIGAGTALVAVASQLYIPIEPVPITMQTLAVLLVGSTLGALRGALALSLYLVLGLVGLPIYSEAASGAGVLFGASGGYIFGFVAAAGLTGWLAQRQWDRKFLGASISFLAGTVVIFAFGMVGLSIALSANLEQTLAWGLYPFLIGGIVKAAMAAAIIPSAWKLTERLASARASRDV